MRASGILLPVSSLPSKYGIGCFSKSAFEWIDFLQESGQTFWQILPLGPTSYGDSPYQSFSTFAGNPYFISLEELIAEGLLTREECETANLGTNPSYVDYEKQYENRNPLLHKAYENSKKREDADFLKFEEEQKAWLPDYALFMALKDVHDKQAWNTWEKELIRKEPEVLAKYREELADEICYYEYLQYWFLKQWLKVKKYANDRGIRIIGDIPIYVAFDSADAWMNPELFAFDEDMNPIEVAGCPPDGFTADVMAETIRRSSLGSSRAGSKVNLERAMAADGRFGGHIVSGHIDGTGVIRSMIREENAIWISIGTSPQILHLIVEKGWPAAEKQRIH